jgi:uncharacterized membrane protein
MAISISATNGIGGMPAIYENATVSATAATGTINYDVLTQSVLQYTTNATANWTLNIRGNSSTTLNSLMTTGQSITLVFMAAQGSPAFINNVVQIDGATVTPRWQGGSAPAGGNVNSTDLYTYAILKTGNATYNVFASLTRFA